MAPELLDSAIATAIARLCEARQAYVIATVVRTVGATAAETLSDGTPRLISLRPEEDLGAPEDQSGVQVARNGCPSKGSMDLFIEPVLPQPELVIIGASPVARSLAALAGSVQL